LNEKKVFIKDIKAGDKITGIFLVTEKNLAFSQKGNPYLNLRIRDKTGEMDGRVWDNAIEINGNFKKSDMIRIEARAVSYRDSIQLSIFDCRTVDICQVNPADFSPASQYDIEEMFLSLMNIVNTIENRFLRLLLNNIFGDTELMKIFKHVPAAKGFHHAYIGGLLEHTLSVARLLIKCADHYEKIDRDLLLTGGILHDIGKTCELSYSSIIEYTDEGRLVGHIVLGVELLDRRLFEIEDFPDELALKLRHILLSHHGVLEFGSPKRPKIIEALLVNFADDLDAKVNAFQEFMKESDGESSWTPFHRLMERYIYKGLQPSTEPQTELKKKL
jgi:3'-5' exoribonuclease